MKTAYWLMALAAALTAAGVGGYRFGQTRTPHTVQAPAAAPRTPLYYRNPMGLADTSPVPKKDSMGMDYVPVYAEDAKAPPGEVALSPDKVQMLGVRSVAATRKALARSLLASGRIEVDERRVYAVAPRFDGFLERLHVNAVGQAVAKGQPLFEVYSPDLVTAQREYAIAMRGAMSLANGEGGAAMQSLAEASLARLRNWDVAPDQIAALVKGGDVKRTLTVRAPGSGIVSEKKAVTGARFMAGEMLYQIADLSSVWLQADVAEQDLGQVRVGQAVQVTVPAFPDRRFSARLSFIYPTMNSETRTVQLRAELPNPGGLLRPGMFAQVDLMAGPAAPVLAIPQSAVIDSGRRQVVLVQRAPGRFVPREVKLGQRGSEDVEVVSGLQEGEQVVVSANFLIDAESNLKSALAGFAGR